MSETNKKKTENRFEPKDVMSAFATQGNLWLDELERMNTTTLEHLDRFSGESRKFAEAQREATQKMFEMGVENSRRALGL